MRVTDMTEKVTVPAEFERKRRIKVVANRSYSDDGTVKLIPMIRFSGAWVALLGFKANGYVDVEINEDGSLTLRPYKG